MKILVFAKGDKVKEALAAGADYAGNEELFEKVNGGGQILMLSSQHPK